jgi:hypothetical protein
VSIVDLLQVLPSCRDGTEERLEQFVLVAGLADGATDGTVDGPEDLLFSVLRPRLVDAL